MGARGASTPGGGSPGSAPARGSNTPAASAGGASANSAGAPGGAPGEGPAGAMGGGVRGGGPSAITASTNVLSGEPSACSGLGAAFISGYYAGINAGNYLKDL